MRSPRCHTHLSFTFAAVDREFTTPISLVHSWLFFKTLWGGACHRCDLSRSIRLLRRLRWHPCLVTGGTLVATSPFPILFWHDVAL
jgi:hypothetical protein